MWSGIPNIVPELYDVFMTLIVDPPNIQAGELDAKMKEQIAQAAGATAHAASEKKPIRGNPAPAPATESELQVDHQ